MYHCHLNHHKAKQATHDAYFYLDAGDHKHYSFHSAARLLVLSGTAMTVENTFEI